MKNYNLIVTVLFKSGVERVYKAQTKEKISEQDIIDGIERGKKEIKRQWREGLNGSWELDNTIINIQDTSAITFSYEEINE